MRSMSSLDELIKKFNALEVFLITGKNLIQLKKDYQTQNINQRTWCTTTCQKGSISIQFSFLLRALLSLEINS